MPWYPSGTPTEAELQRMQELFVENTGNLPPRIVDQLPALAAELQVAFDGFDQLAGTYALFNAFEGLAEYVASVAKLSGLDRAFKSYYDDNPTRTDGLWEALFGFGPQGVAIAVVVNGYFHDGVVTTEAVRLLRQSDKPYRLSEQSEPADRPTVPTPMSADRQRLHDALVSAGFEVLEKSMYKGTYPAAEERTQMIWVMLDEPQLLLMSPIAILSEGDLPTIAQGQDFGRYTLEKYPPFAVIQILLPITTGFATLHLEAETLATYADRWEAVIAPGADDL